MGTAVSRWSFTDEDYQNFQSKLYQQLEQLKDIIKQPTFGQEPLKIGAELEMYLTDKNGNVSFSNQFLLDKLNDEQFQPELNKYNLELNLSAFKQSENPFKQLHEEMKHKTAIVESIAAQSDINVVPIGILPTLAYEHLNMSNMTNIPRYHNLANHLYKQRGKAFDININGEEPISLSCDDISAEGANTSFQVHFMLPPEKFASTFNAAQLTSPLVAAVGANSPLFLGNRLWDETRIALFKQSLDIRLPDQVNWQQPTRVNFGFGWVRESPWELFAEAVSLYPTILPAIDSEKNKHKLPALKELSLHMGTLWPWHRPVYCNHGNGHIRIEFRAIPAGPTSIDMIANAAFAIGLANGLSKNISELICFTPFRYAEYNFYRAAQYGLDAKILWPLRNPYSPEEVPIIEVIYSLLPTAKEGLKEIGISDSESTLYLNIIKQRLDEKMTGAIWQKRTLDKLEESLDKKDACRQLVLSYFENCKTCLPVAQWDQTWL